MTWVLVIYLASHLVIWILTLSFYGSTWLSQWKIIYYTVFSWMYGMVGSCAHLIMVNSSWTQFHIENLWGIPDRIKRVYPPCDTSGLQVLFHVIHHNLSAFCMFFHVLCHFSVIPYQFTSETGTSFGKIGRNSKNHICCSISSWEGAHTYKTFKLKVQQFLCLKFGTLISSTNPLQFDSFDSGTWSSTWGLFCCHQKIRWRLAKT